MAGGNALATLNVIANILLSYFLSLIFCSNVYGDNSRTKASH
jgi:hypothetical protein